MALVLPVLLLLGLVLWRFAAAERTRYERDAFDHAQALALALDRDLTGVFASLDVLSTSPFLTSGDLEGFHAQASEILRRQGITAVLLDPAGRQLVNVRLPWGAPLPEGNVALDRQAIESGRPSTTDLLVGRVTGTRQFLATVPVLRDGSLRYVLFFSLPLARLQQLVKELDLGPAYTASILDRQWRLMARSSRAEEHVGSLASEDVRQGAASGLSGTFAGTSFDGVPVFGAFARSRLSGFTAAVGLPYSDLNAPVWRSLSLFGLTGAAVAALSTWLALFVGRRITRPITGLARTAAQLGRGEEVAPVSTGLSEVNQVGRVLVAASSNLRERETELREANEELQRFAYIVSHDLRSPLVNIMGFTTELEALRDDLFARLSALQGPAPAGGGGDDLRADFDEAIGFIKASISKMDRLINAILRLSREGRREFHPERVDMNALMEGIRGSLMVQAGSADATVSAGPLPGLNSDRLALEQIFSNLVDNALKYGRAGVPGRVEVAGQTRGRNVVYEVRDNGRGIDPRDVERVFDLFRRSGPQDRPGEGIGLAHVRALVRRLGGSIALTSRPGAGSTFTVTLPRRWPHAGARSAA